MEIGIIGLAGSGKTTVFNALAHETAKTGAYSSGEVKANLGVVEVPDPRVDFVAGVFSPKKTTYARIHYVDLAGLGSDRFAVSDKLGKTDALAIVVRAFESDDCPHAAGSVDPVRDLKTVESLKRGLREFKAESDVMSKCRACLEAERPLRELELSEDEAKLLRPYALLTLKPVLVIVNIGERDLAAGGSRSYNEIRQYLESASSAAITEIPALLESELGVLAAAERAAFMEEMGLDVAGADAVARAGYGLLDLISFITYGPDEVRAWTIKRGTRAQQAAGKIHTDIERGFIRAEVIAFEDFEAAAGAISRVKEMGKFRLEGKDYVVRDGDLFIVRFQV
jgi:ribosome-binding ATPase YchF (GTP1/OBG family)